MTTTTQRETRHASWLELFYDLLFVALFVQLAHGLLHDTSVGTTLKVLGLFAPAWWAWVSNTVSSNVFGEEGPAHRLMLLVTMACLLLMIGGVPDALDGDPGLYAAGYAAGRLVLLALVAAWHIAQPGAPRPTISYVLYSASALLWAVSIPLGAPGAYWLWAVSVGGELVVRVWERTRDQSQGTAVFDLDLLVERFGLLVIVALGEGVVQIASAVADAGGDRDTTVVATGVAAFAVLAALWWTYFDFARDEAAALERDPSHAVAVTRDVFVFGHFVLVGAVLAASAGLGAIIDAAASGESASTSVGLLCDALVVYTLASAFIAWRLGGGPLRDLVVAALPTLGVLGVLAFVGDEVTPPVMLAAIVAAIAAGQLGRRRP